MFSWKKPFAVLLILSQFAGFASAHETPPVDAKAPLVQLAILLDTSNSMDGLIEQAKGQLWKIANELAYAKRDGKTPTLQVALYEYGNDNLRVGENYIRQVMPFTTNMDQVSAQLFALRTNGGSEYCGAVIRDAVNGLTWDSRPDVYKVVFIAGNEPFTQGPVAFQESIAQAAQKGINVNTIFCGNYAEGVQTQWDAGARLAHGRYFNIDSDQKIVVIPTPYDADILRLGSTLDETFVVYGKDGRAVMQEAESANAMASLGSAAGAPLERSVFKASKQYYSRSEDVVSQVSSGRMKAQELKKNDLPAALQSKSPAELDTYFKEQQAKRDAAQKQIGVLKVKREAFIADARKNQSTGGALTLDQAVQKAVREQAGAKGLRF